MNVEPIINKVESSGLLTLDLETYLPKGEMVVFDMKPFLFMELILKEKDFRADMQAHDWSVYTDKNVAITCSADAIIPMWAYMLVASNLQPVAKDFVFGDLQKLQDTIMLKNLAQINAVDYADARVVIKGCGEMPISETAYVEITKLLRPFAKSIMYGEPCSTVPIYKKK
jgi:hypothetical protein